jgi:hypothetical protein
MVFNRWGCPYEAIDYRPMIPQRVGMVVFTTKNEPGVYVYLAEVELLTDYKGYTGDVTLMK